MVKQIQAKPANMELPVRMLTLSIDYCHKYKE